MRIKKIFFSLFLIGIITAHSCKKTDNTTIENTVNNDPVNTKITSIEIDPIKKRYVSQSGEQYYAGIFADMRETQTFKIQLEAGKGYRIMAREMNNPYMQMKLVLLNENQDTLTVSGFSLVGTSYIFYTAKSTGAFYLKVSLVGDEHPDLNYHLQFECIDDAYIINWANQNWKASGSWRVNEDSNIVFKGENTGIMRWLKLDNNELLEYNASFQCRVKSGEGITLKGLSVSASPEMLLGDKIIFFKYNLPKNSYSILLNAAGDPVRLDANSGAVSINSGDNVFQSSTTPNVDDWVSYNVAPDGTGSHNVTFTWNNVSYSNTCVVSKGSLYILVNDNSMDEIEFKDFVLLQ